jgi:tetratricopeptide (TPR) repeat protein
MLCVATTASAARAQDDRTVCFSIGSDDWKQPGYLERALRACTREIDSGRRRGTALASAYRARGYWLHKKGDLDEALRDFALAIKLDPKNVESYDYRADVWLDKGDFERAIADYTQAIKIDPGYAPAYYARGRAYEKLSRIDRAIADYRAALARPARDRIGEWAHRQARQRLDALLKK